MPAKAVIARDEELASLQAFLAEVGNGPTALLFSGEPGIGKTMLWEVGVEDARSSFGRVLAHRSVEAEALLSFAGLSDLLAPIFHGLAPSLAPPRRHALEVALLLAEPSEQAPDPRAIGFALLDVLQMLAKEGPVVVALDDVQWLDSSSALVLQIALRRLREEPVGLLATSRKLPQAGAAFELERAFPEERLTRHWLGPLSLGALHHLLKERLGLELTRSELARVQETSGGNPFFALELGRELGRTNARPAAGRALGVPESLRELLGGRLSRLPGETVDVLVYAAALARPTVELVAMAHPDRQVALTAFDAAVREGVVELEGSRVRFANPLLASACYEQTPPQRRRAVHRALAGAVTDAEERARHLALAADEPDPLVASALDTAAEHAGARGATAAAAELCELAAELTPGDPALARQRQLRSASFHRLAGDRARATVQLQRLLPQATPGVERADVLFGLASTRVVDSPTMIELCDEALAEAAGDDARSARILAYRSWAHQFQADIRPALLDARAALEKAERVGDPGLLAVTIAQVGMAETRVTEITPGLLERGAEPEERLGLELEHQASPSAQLARRLVRMGELDQARPVFEEQARRAAARGDESGRGDALWILTLLEWLAGRWQLALEYARAGLELSEQTQDRALRTFVGRFRALVETDLGLVEEARASAEEGLALARTGAGEAFALPCLGALGRLELALGNLEAAGAYLRDLPARMLALGLNDPAQPVWPDAIETLLVLGELERARSYLEQYELHSSRLGGGLAVGGAARCRGLLAAAEGDLGAAFEAYARALDVQAGLPLERGRTLLCLGSARRQAKQKRAARDTLEEALAIFDQLGARLWAEKARAELKRISGRRRASDEELTEMEERVARLAADGRSNKEIAAELFVSVHTVSAHLSRVYRKLGISSRSKLASRLAIPDDGAAKPPTEPAKTASEPPKL
jgi:DNA-binding CsgD family transcriptional regulator/DNA polymerase III delta prime subunit